MNRPTTLTMTNIALLVVALTFDGARDTRQSE
jgi:hypothetical protein